MDYTKLIPTLCLTLFILAHVTLAQSTPKDWVDTHNEFRAEVGVAPVSWNGTLAKYAKNYANKRIGDCELEHSMGPYAESIAQGDDTMTGVAATKYWATEKPFYDSKSNKCVKDECGHYMNIIASETTQIGCARSKCKNGGVFVICNYV